MEIEKKHENKNKHEGQRLLLHTCCGPCSTAVLERLISEGYEPDVFYFNPNITDPEEYEKRLDNQRRVISAFSEGRGHKIELIEGRYEPDEFYEAVRGLEAEKEGGRRCEACFRLRLKETAKTAAELGYALFDTSLSVSPHKNYALIREIGSENEGAGLSFLGIDYKKKDGFKRSTELSRELGLYRQNYCGCEFSKWWLKER